jgi:hypothetical protein
MFVDPPQAGQALSASFLAALLAELYRLGRVTGDGSILVEDDPSGFSFKLGGAIPPGVKFIKVTSVVSGAFAWTEQLPVASGGWTDGSDSGTTSDDPAYELNNFGSVALNKVYPAWRSSIGDLRFQSDQCP